MAGKGTSIVALDYNNIYNKIAPIMGPGSGNSGYNQSLNSATVPSTRTIISAAQWSSLRTDLLHARQHQTGLDESGKLTDPSPTCVFTGTLVGNTLTITTITSGVVKVGYRVTGSGVPATTMITAFGTGSGTTGTYSVSTTTVNTGSISMTAVGAVVIYEDDRAAYSTFADVITTNKLISPPSGQAALETYLLGQTSSSWNSSVSVTLLMTFADSPTCRSFFNAGGNLQFSASLSPDVTNLKNTSWKTMLANMGTITINHNSTTMTGTGVPTSAKGFYQLTTTPTLMFQKLTETPTYSPNQLDIYAYVDSVSTPRILTVNIQFLDLATYTNTTTYPVFGGGSAGPFGIDENVSGLLTCLIQAYRPSGANVSVTAPILTKSSTGGTWTLT
jgi:hypothetical protein